MSFVTLAIPIQLEGYVITMFWAAEMVLLLWLWQRSKINIFRLGFFALSLLTIVSYLMDVNNYYIDHYHEVSLTPFLNGSFITGIVIVIGFALSLFLLNKENAEDIITFRGRETFSIKNIKYLFKFALTILLFSVFYLEFNYQLEVHTDTTYSQAFRNVSLATYTTCFVAGLAILFRNKINTTKYFFFLGCVVIYSLLYSFLVAELRSHIFFSQEYSASHFLIHLISLPAIGYLIYLLVVNIRPLMQEQFKVIAWALVILSYIILSVELDNVVIWISGNPETYFDRLYDVHTFGYPILWGAIAMILMIWGLKQKEVLLRQISLISFGLIIVKFYTFDAWRMSQTGLIISFVVLGAILLVVSFLQQKIKTLVKDDDKKEVLDDKNKES